MLLGGATFMALAVLFHFGFSPEAMFAKATEMPPAEGCADGSGRPHRDPVSAISVGMTLMFGTAGLPTS